MSFYVGMTGIIYRGGEGIWEASDFLKKALESAKLFSKASEVQEYL